MISCIILAAGISKRFHTNLPKVLHKILGKPMVYYPIKAVKDAFDKVDIVLVVSDEDLFRNHLGSLDGITFVTQNPPLGTGDAVKKGLSAVGEDIEDILVLCGDVPLITPETLKKFHQFHVDKKGDVTILTMFLDDPSGYGRIVRCGDGVEEIVEEKDASDEVKKIKEVNTGIYFFKRDLLKECLEKLDRNNAQGEYYLTDVVKKANEMGFSVYPFPIDDYREVLGVNNRWEMSLAIDILRERIIKGLSLSGVTFIDPDTAFVEEGVEMGVDVIIYPNVYIEGDTKVGNGVFIGPNTRIVSSILEDNVEIEGFSVIKESIIRKGTRVGPFSHIRPNSDIGPNAKIGNFVEVKKSRIGQGTKVNHLSYIGDSEVGRDVNVGAGTITCNYDGYRKYKTVIEDEAFIGSDTQLVAPVKVGKKAVIAAGSTITKDVPEGSLAVTRVKQKHIPNWRDRRDRERGGGS